MLEIKVSLFMRMVVRRVGDHSEEKKY